MNQIITANTDIANIKTINPRFNPFTKDGKSILITKSTKIATANLIKITLSPYNLLHTFHKFFDPNQIDSFP